MTSGKVVITDLSDDMLAIARENAASKGLTNIETCACYVCELPFEDNMFDAISCRFGFMFFPDMLMVAKEIARVLKPGGKLNCKTADVYWNMMTEVGEPIAAELSKADEAMKEKIITQVLALVKKRYPEGDIAIVSGALVFYGEK